MGGSLRIRLLSLSAFYWNREGTVYTLRGILLLFKEAFFVTVDCVFGLVPPVIVTKYIS